RRALLPRLFAPVSVSSLLDSCVPRSGGLDQARAMPETWGLDRTAEGVFVHGELDLAVADSFAEQASEVVLETAGPSVLIDLSGVTFMDSSGLRALLRVVGLGDGKTLIIQPSRQVFTLLHLAGLMNGDLSNVEVLEPQS